jgi:hypothetical protein
MHSQDIGALPRKPSQRTLATALLCGALAATPLFAAVPTRDGTTRETPSVRGLLERFDQVMARGILCGEACMAAGECTSECVASHEAWKCLVVDFQKQPEAWKTLRPVFAAKFRAEETSCAVKGRMLDFLAQGQSPECGELSVELLESDPAAFGADHLLLFAAGGCETFGKAVADALARTECPTEKLLYSAFLANKGNKVGQPILESALEKPLGAPGDLAHAYLAAKALEKLGAPARIDELTKKAHDAALESLDAGDVDHARGIALEATLGRETVASAYAYLPYFEGRLKWALGTGTHEYPDAESVFGLVEKLTAN